MDMLDFDIILGIDWLSAYRVVIDCRQKKVVAHVPNRTPFQFKGDMQDSLTSTKHRMGSPDQRPGRVASLIVNEENQIELELL